VTRFAVQCQAALRHAAWLGVLLASLIPAASFTQQPTEPTPQLRVEPGAHTAPIRALSVDGAGRFAVTAAEDKTARVWDLATGAQLQVLRPPGGQGSEGKLYAAAISADGRFVAAGGFSAQNDVYVFQRSSGLLVHRITGLPNVITHLAFTPDGKRLVINLWAAMASACLPATMAGLPAAKWAPTPTTTANRMEPTSPATERSWRPVHSTGCCASTPSVVRATRRCGC